MTVEVEFQRPDGSVRRARAWVDTGGTSLVLAEPLARDLGLDLSALPPNGGEHSVATTSPAPPMRVGGVPLDTVGHLGDALDPCQSAVTLLMTMPGLGETAARVLVAEIGVDLTRFPSAGHLRLIGDISTMGVNGCSIGECSDPTLSRSHRRS